MSALRSYALLVKWQGLRSKGFLPFAIVIQAFFSLGIVVGFPLLVVFFWFFGRRLPNVPRNSLPRKVRLSCLPIDGLLGWSAWQS